MSIRQWADLALAAIGLVAGLLLLAEGSLAHAACALASAMIQLALCWLPR